ncbi:hypothetical protein GCM10017557_75210 [Streptomyces aurantiacus]|uniref:Uncharacterized protein n=1 Tax=Streptomyces aurantiacus TaxID=47760 RepID=A0A7G1PC80_9ACTN|nr:hypothetical protein GCM10017557_75210 [Streptomyces aurantiacus]
MRFGRALSWFRSLIRRGSVVVARDGGSGRGSRSSARPGFLFPYAFPAPSSPFVTGARAGGLHRRPCEQSARVRRRAPVRRAAWHMPSGALARMRPPDRAPAAPEPLPGRRHQRFL